MTTFVVQRMGAASVLTRDGSGWQVPELFMPDKYNIN